MPSTTRRTVLTAAAAAGITTATAGAAHASDRHGRTPARSSSAGSPTARRYTAGP